MNHLEWLHQTARDMSVTTVTSYSAAMTALLRASDVLAEAWDDGFAAGANYYALEQPLPPNPYQKEIAK